MRTSRLLAVLLPLALMAGCAGTENRTGAPDSQRAAGPATDDASIAAKVKEALAANPATSGLKVAASASQGTVTLKGEVKSLALRRQVESVVRDVQGVKSVNNQLIVTG